MSVFLVGLCKNYETLLTAHWDIQSLHLTSLSAHTDIAVSTLLPSLPYYLENLSCYHQLSKTQVPSPLRVLKPKLDFISWLHNIEPQLSCLHFNSSIFMESLFDQIEIKLGLTNQICYKETQGD